MITYTDYKPYDAVISIRLNNKFYRLLKKYNKNICAIIRSLIRAEINDAYIEISDTDIKKMFSVFDSVDLHRIKRYTYCAKKDKYINVRLYAQEKEIIRHYACGNINDYIDNIILKFINKIIYKYEDNTSWIQDSINTK